jgi:hypothetical protein
MVMHHIMTLTTVVDTMREDFHILATPNHRIKLQDKELQLLVNTAESERLVALGLTSSYSRIC